MRHCLWAPECDATPLALICLFLGVLINTSDSDNLIVIRNRQYSVFICIEYELAPVDRIRG